MSVPPSGKSVIVFKYESASYAVGSRFATPKFRHSSDEKKLILQGPQENFVFSDLMDRDLKPWLRLEGFF
jgi:hypothetical protein